MSEWWSYAPSDFLLFSPRVYWRLIEAHNAALWPLHGFAVAIGLGILLAVLRPRPGLGRLACLALGALWLAVAWTFLHGRYAGINWAIFYVAPLFAVQGALLLAAGALPGLAPIAPGGSLRRSVAAALIGLAVVAYPFAAWLSGRSWTTAEAFGVMPDPTALATLGLAACARPPWRYVLAPLPALWCFYGGMTLWTMGAVEAWIVLAGGAAGLALALGGHASGRA